MSDKTSMGNLLYLLPYWHYKIERPIKHLLKNSKISFETYYCLKMLSTGDPIKMSDLSLFLHMSKQQTTKMISGLYEYGFVKRIYDPKDRRIIRIKITPKALAYFKNYEKNLQEQFLANLEKEMPTKDIEKLNTLIEELSEILIKK